MTCRRLARPQTGPRYDVLGYDILNGHKEICAEAVDAILLPLAPSDRCKVLDFVMRGYHANGTTAPRRNRKRIYDRIIEYLMAKDERERRGGNGAN